MTATIPKVETVKILEPGVGFTSILVNLFTTPLSGAPDTAKQDVWNGFGYGFIFNQIGPNAAPLLYVEVRGVGNQSNDVIAIVPGQYYDCPFTSLKIVPSLQGNATQGIWVVNIGIKSYAKVLPSAVPTTPTASGGTPFSYSYLQAVMNLTAAAPVASEGDALTTQSMFRATVKVAAGQTITGGSLDIWRKIAGEWSLAGNVALPTGAQIVSVPADYLGPYTTAGTDRIYIIPNGVTVSGAATTVTVTQELQ